MLRSTLKPNELNIEPRPLNHIIKCVENIKIVTLCVDH